MANSSLNLTSLDFDKLKGDFKTFLKSQDTFKDYDFEGSNMNVLLDVMSYNTFMNAWYLNMIGSEMFIDSAQKRDSIVSHAKELNYVPQSMKSSEAKINLQFTTVGLSGSLVVPSGTIFTGSNANGTYNFVTTYNATYTSSNSTYYANNVELFEGSPTTESFIVDYTIENQRFILSNKNIDLNSLKINVIENNGASNTIYSKAETLFGLTSNSTIFFVQAAENNKYEVLFGDGYFGKVPQNGAVVTASYRICHGPEADGVSSFTLAQDLGLVNAGQVIVSNLTVTANSTSGANAESQDSIRFRAPRWFATQQRGVANDDYKQLILGKFGTYIQDINVFGGEEVEPKQYGCVVVSIKPYGSTALPNFLKSQIEAWMVDKSQMRLMMIDPEYLFLRIDTTVQYDKTLTSLYSTDIENLVMQSMTTFSSTNLEKFDSDFRYSRFVNAIDDTDISIISNDTEIFVTKRISPLLNYPSSYTFTYNNECNTVETPSITSSAFTFIVEGVSYPLSFIKDDGNGKLIVYTFINNTPTTLGTIGSIDYTTGTVKIDSLLVGDYDKYISIYMKPLYRDIISKKSNIILIEPVDMNITVTDVKK